MIKADTDFAIEFANKSDLEHALEKARSAYNDLLEGKGLGNEWLGWRRILKQPNDAELERIERTAERIRNEADIFIVCGIGGSYLGAKAVIDALGKRFAERGPEILYAGHHIGANYLEGLIRYIDRKKDDGSPMNVFVNVISKSGTTLETALAFRVIRNWMEKTYGDEANNKIIATTGPDGGVLNKLIDQFGYEKYVIPEDVGGRYSVLTPVGLLPIAVAGIDIQTLFYSAVTKFNETEQSADDLLEYAALRYLFQEADKAIDVIGSFEPELNSFTGWIQQLLGESEGKEGKGMFPVTASYSTDLHSIGQMIQQGQRNLIETFLVIKDPISTLSVDNGKESEDGLGYLKGKQIHEINRHALDGTIEAHVEGGVPVFRIILEKLNTQSIGELIYFYELFTAVYVYMLGVNPFNQPGVEDYKKAMYKKLGKS